MPLVSIRLPDEAQLSREAARLERPKSELARDAIIAYLVRIERERFLNEIARRRGRAVMTKRSPS
jgi:predicted transcriptional regulator